MSQELLTEYARAMYRRVNAKWEERGSEIFGGACGFSILSGPPIHRPDLMIIGENPGFGADDHEPHVETMWPATSYIPTADWVLARRLRQIMSEAGLAHLLDRAIQTNFNFFKSSSISPPGRHPWTAVDPGVRREVERLCRDELNGFIERSRPAWVLVLGIGALERHAQDVKPAMTDRNGRRTLIATGAIAGAPAVGPIHPTGARVASSDWARVVEWLRLAIPRCQGI